jgi:signal transduction histidine kinase
MPRKEAADIRKVVQHALALGEKGVADKKIRVQTCFTEPIPLLQIDASMLEQAFLNLILNAVDAMGEGGLLTFSVRMADEDATMVEVEIADNGCGIDEQDMPHLFNPFFTRKKYGTGLGLTQVKKIVDLHQGIVDIFSTKGEGTRVRIRFPAQPEDSAGSHAGGGSDE